MSADRHNLLHPTAPRARATSKPSLEGHAGPVIAATDYMRNYADQIRSHVPRRYVTLGTDGFGRSDYRVKLRRFFEVNRYYVVDRGAEGAGRRRRRSSLTSSRRRSRNTALDTERPDPWTV